jgi:hypothetical protein
MPARFASTRRRQRGQALAADQLPRLANDRVPGRSPPLANPVYAAILGPDAQAADPQVHDIVAKAFRRPEHKGMYLAMRSAMLLRPDLSDTISSLPARTLFAAGADGDLWVPRPHGRRRHDA